MRIAWWMFNSTDSTQFTMNSPKHCNEVFKVLRARGHTLLLNGVPKPPLTLERNIARAYRDPGPFDFAWVEGGRAFREFLEREIVPDNGAIDPQNKAQRALAAWMSSSEWRPLDNVDVQYIELFPCVSLRAKLELSATVVRAIRSGVPAVLVDQDFNAHQILSTTDDLYRIAEQAGYPNWDRDQLRKLFWLWTPYERRLHDGNQLVALPSYNVNAERELDYDVEAEFTFGYVGNDYQREEYLAQFYRRTHADGRNVRNAVWGRWDLERYSDLLSTVGPEAFKGPVPPSEIHNCYQRCAASIGITHRAFYGPKLIAFRWFEVTEAGRLFYVDAKLRNSLQLVLDEMYVRFPEEALAKLEKSVADNRYWEQVENQRARLRADERLRPEWTANRLEELVREGTITPATREVPVIHPRCTIKSL